MPAKGDITQRLDLDTALDGLRGLDGFADTPDGALERLHVKGLFHDHVRIAGTPYLLRLPRSSQFGLEPVANLAYQSACFARAEPSGCTPALAGVIAPRAGLAYGGLVVAMIDGVAARLPDDMPAIAACLAGIHGVALPPEGDRPPLSVHADPIAGILSFIEHQARFLDRAGLGGDARAQIEEEIAWARDFAARNAGAAQPITLCGTDTHPGNFLIQRPGSGQGGSGQGGSGRAVFVDLEKALYGSPAVDVAHASLYTSTMWDPDCEAVLSRRDVIAFYGAYLALIPEDLARALDPWLLPMRRLTWLRTTTWYAKWRVEAEAWSKGMGVGESTWWRAAAGAPDLVADVGRRIDGFFDPATIAMVRRDWLGPDPISLDRPAG